MQPHKKLVLVLAFSNDKETLTNRFGSDPQLLPMVRVRERSGSLCSEGIALLRQMMGASQFGKYIKLKVDR